MSAVRHINGQQFMSVRHLMKLPGVDAAPIQRDRTKESRTGRVASTASGKKNEYTRPGSALHKIYPELPEAIANGTVDPVHVDTAEKIRGQYGLNPDVTPARERGHLMLGNGHHRVAIAHAQGTRWLPITTDHAESVKNE